MYFDYTVDIPDVAGIRLHPIRGVVYVDYAYEYTYDKEKRRTIPHKTTIGKQCPENPDKMWPNPNFVKFFPDIKNPQEEERMERSASQKFGVFLVIQKILEDSGLMNMLQEILKDDCGLFLDLVAYTIISENNAGQYYPNYAFDHVLFSEGMHIYSESSVSNLLHYKITKEMSVAFLEKWNERRSHADRIYISYDSTNKNCQAGDVEIAEYGYAKDDPSKKIVNYALAFDQSNREPVLYEAYQGSVTDVMQLTYTIRKVLGYGYSNFALIIDRGYFSYANFKVMDELGINFVVLMKGKKALVKELVLKVKGSFEEHYEYDIFAFRVSGITLKGKLFKSDEEEQRNFHIYYDGYRAAEEHNALREKLQGYIDEFSQKVGEKYTLTKAQEKYFDPVYSHRGEEDEAFMNAIPKKDVIDEETKLCGYFVLITSEEMTAARALELYKGRDSTEKLFRSDKSYLGNRSFRVQSTDSVNAKVFLEFVALIVRNRMFVSLTDYVNQNHLTMNYMNVAAAIQNLEKLELVRQPDGTYCMDHAVSRQIQIIMKAWGIDLNYIKQHAEQLSWVLAENSKNAAENTTQKRKNKWVKSRNQTSVDRDEETGEHLI